MGIVMTQGGSTLGDYALGPAPKTGVRLFLKGDTRYLDLLRRAFPVPASWYGPYDSFAAQFDYVLYAQGIEDRALASYLDMAKQTLLIPSTLDECWALSHHMAPEGRSEVGQLVYDAKTYANKLGRRDAAERLCEIFSERFAAHSAVGRCDVVTSVPANPPKEGHDLPELLARATADRHGQRFDQGLLTKDYPTPQVKDLPNDEKAGALVGAFSVTRSLTGASIVVVDDVVRSGTTLGHIAAVLREAGAADVIGLVATKTMRD